MSNNKQNKRGLGRGLSALMADIDVPTAPAANKAGGKVLAEQHLPIEKVHPNPDQPRRDFAPEDLDDLSASIAERGIIQPLIVREDPKRAGHFQIVAGERRWRAAQRAKLHEVPVLIRDFNDQEVLEVAIIENIQRADLNSVEEALGYRQLMDKFGHTQEKLSDALGKSRSHIANILRLLNLPAEVQAFLREGKLSAGHARAMITSDDALNIARHVIKNNLSVRETEALVKSGLRMNAPKPGKKPQATKDSDTRALETDLSANLKMKVSIAHKDGSETGLLKISYKSLDELDDLCRILSTSN
jgi:ParB family chromosome partitioning protein